MGTRCPRCNGKNGRVYAWIVVQRISMKNTPGGAKRTYLYWRMTHKKSNGKRRYCYVRVEKVKDEDLPPHKVPEFQKLKLR